MSENLNEAITLDQAVEQMMDDTPEETEIQPEADQVEPETDQVEAEDGETEAEDEPETEPSFEVETVDGKKKLTLSQIKDGVMLKADYTRKTMALAEERKAAERAAAEASQIKQQLTEALQVWAVPAEQEPDWQALARTATPQEFNMKRVEWETRQRKAMQAREQYRALQEQQQRETIATEYQRLLEVVPEWRDETKFKAAAAKMQEAGTTYGLSAEEIAGVTDHRLIRILHDAARYQELQKGKAAVTKKVAQAPTTLKPGSKPDQSQGSEAARQKQRARLKKTGDINDALELLFSR
jgi:hypothetical protein